MRKLRFLAGLDQFNIQGRDTYTSIKQIVILPNRETPFSWQLLLNRSICCRFVLGMKSLTRSFSLGAEKILKLQEFSTRYIPDNNELNLDRWLCAFTGCMFSHCYLSCQKIFHKTPTTRIQTPTNIMIKFRKYGHLEYKIDLQIGIILGYIVLHCVTELRRHECQVGF